MCALRMMVCLANSTIAQRARRAKFNCAERRYLEVARQPFQQGDLAYARLAPRAAAVRPAAISPAGRPVQWHSARVPPLARVLSIQCRTGKPNRSGAPRHARARSVGQCAGIHPRAALLRVMLHCNQAIVSWCTARVALNTRCEVASSSPSRQQKWSDDHATTYLARLIGCTPPTRDR
jgi:hypothetical protein